MKHQGLALLIFGPHRSGTSALTRVLNLLGVDLGTSIMPPKSDNPLGFWEHAELFKIHEELLQHAGSSWHEYRPLPSDWKARQGVDECQSAMFRILQTDFSDSPIFGVKDPRISRLLPIWLELLEATGIEPRLIILVRNPLEVINSLQVRNEFRFHKCLLLYLTEMLAAIRNSQGHRRKFVSYSDLLEDWPHVVAAIEERLGVEWPHQPDDRAEEIATFLTPGERHQYSDLEELRNHPLIPEQVTILYEALVAATLGNEERLATCFPETEAFFNAAASLFIPELDFLSAELSRLALRVASLEPTSSSSANLPAADSTLSTPLEPDPSLTNEES